MVLCKKNIQSFVGYGFLNDKINSLGDLYEFCK